METSMRVNLNNDFAGYPGYAYAGPTRGAEGTPPEKQQSTKQDS